MSLSVQIDKQNGIPIYVQIEEQIRMRVHRGDIKPGDPMPTVRELAVQLEINSNTVARVYRDLQQAGLLELKRGIGTFVSETSGIRPIPGRDLHALERRVDALIGVSRRMNMTPVELFQFIESRWEDKKDVDR